MAAVREGHNLPTREFKNETKKGAGRTARAPKPHTHPPNEDDAVYKCNIAEQRAEGKLKLNPDRKCARFEPSPEVERAPAVLLKIGTTQRRAEGHQFHDHDFVAQLHKQCSASSSVVSVRLGEVLAFSPDDRQACLGTLRSIQADNGLDIKIRGKKYVDLFEALVALLVGDRDLAKFQATTDAVLEAAVILHKDSLGVACGRVANRLQELGVKGAPQRELLATARRIEQHFAAATSGDAPDSADDLLALDNVPLPAGSVIPKGWALSSQGVFLETENGPELVLNAPLVVSKRLVDLDRGTESLDIGWKREKKWIHRVVDRAVALNSRMVVDALAGYGAPVTSNNVKEFVQYVSDLEAANIDLLPREFVSRRLGWQGDRAKMGFLWGTNLIRESGADSSAGAVRFQGADEGEQQLAEAFFASGTFEAWRNGIRKVANLPRVLFGLYASFVPPLFEIVGGRGFVVDFSGRTTSGKTNAVWTAASVWGNPEILVGTWDSTAVWRERAPSVLGDLPFYLDDTKDARTSEDVANTIYGVVHGRGRGRGTTKGLARQAIWNTVLVTSGEQPATSFTKDAGTRPRVISLWGSPYGATNRKNGALVRQMYATVRRNFGHAGPRFIQFLLDNRKQWSQWKKNFNEQVELLASRGGDNTIAARMATHLAAVSIAAELAHTALEFPWNHSDLVELLWDKLIGESQDADMAKAALRHTIEWAVAHEAEFVGRAPEEKQPSAGWAGRWDPRGEYPTDDKSYAGPFLGFLPAKLENVLRDGGFEFESTVRLWEERGFLICSKERSTMRRRYKVRLGKGSTPVGLVAIKGEAVKNAMDQ